MSLAVFKSAIQVFTQAAKGGPGSGWFAPPAGTHGPGSQGAPATFFHVTRSADKIEREGFDLSKSGSSGGHQLGQGVYLGRVPEQWRSRLIGWGNPAELLQVKVDMSKVADLDHVSFGKDFDTWAEKAGYLHPEGGGATKKFLDVIDAFGGWQDDALWQVKTEFLRDQGYHGMYDRLGDNLVIWDQSAIKGIEKISWAELAEFREQRQQ